MIVSIGIAGSAHADFDSGVAAEKRGDYATAVAEWRLLSEQGHREAQYKLALLFSFGKGVPVDFEQAVRWLQRSADQGYPPAQFRLGQHYYGGVGVDRDRDQGIYWVGVASSLRFDEANRWANNAELNLTPAEELKLIKRVGAWRPRPESQVSAAPPDIVPAVAIDSTQAGERTVEVDSARVEERSVEAAVAPPAVAPRIVAKTAAAATASRIQVGAVRSRDAALQEWNRIKRRGGALLDGFQADIVRADLGPPRGVYYRLHVGPIVEPRNAESLCDALSRRGVNCFVVDPSE
jgi:hypothetical protein